MAKTRWAKVNKCVICGGNLTFVRDTAPCSKGYEGVKQCEQHHSRFWVKGVLDMNHQFVITFYMPK